MTQTNAALIDEAVIDEPVIDAPVIDETAIEDAAPASAQKDITADLERIVGALEVPRDRIESAFVSVGDQLSKCASLLSRITTVFEALPQDLESPELLEATERLTAVAQRAEEIAQSFSVEQDDLERLVATVNAARQPIADLRKVIQMIGIVAINARVVAAGVVGKLEDFDVFTTDIADLSRNATNTIVKFSEVYHLLSTDVHKAAEQRAKFQATHQDSLGAVATRLSKNLAEVTRRRVQSAEGSKETSRVSRQISMSVGTTVMAMQVGDSTRQRIEHVEAGFTLLADLLKGQPPADVTLEDGDDQAVSGLMVQLQGAQLQGIIDEFAHEVAEAEQALGNLAADARSVIATSREIYGHGAEQDNSALSILSADMRQAAIVLQNCEAERQKLDRVAVAVGATVEQLLGHVEAVQEIEGNMRLVTLNAAVKCAQLGPRGRALDVIAQQLRQLTGDTVTSANAAMTELKQAATLAKTFTDSATGEAAGMIGRLEQEAMAAIGLFETVDGRLRDALGVLESDGNAATRILADAVRGFSGHGETTETLADINMQIAGLDPEADPEAAGMASERPAIQTIMQLVRKGYTMDSERRIHDAIAGSPADAADAEGAGDDADAEDDDIFF